MAKKYRQETYMEPVGSGCFMTTLKVLVFLGIALMVMTILSAMH